MRAVADNRALAAVAGIDIDRVVVVHLDPGRRARRARGRAAGLVQNAFTPNFGFALLLPIFAAVVLGGIGSAYGALVGGLVLGLVMELSTWDALRRRRRRRLQAGGRLRRADRGLLVRPQGVFGKARVL